MNYYYSIKYSIQNRKPLFGRNYKVIEPIAVCMRSEDGREHLALSNNLNAVLCSDWEQENILKKIIEDFVVGMQKINVNLHNRLLHELDNRTIPYQYRQIQKIIGQPNEQICQQLIEFVNPCFKFHEKSYSKSESADPSTRLYKNIKLHNATIINQAYYPQPTFYAYNSNEHMALVSLFNKWPTGWPNFTHCLKQRQEEISNGKKINLNLYKSYPPKPNCQGAPHYAEYTEQLHKFFKTLN